MEQGIVKVQNIDYGDCLMDKREEFDRMASVCPQIVNTIIEVLKCAPNTEGKVSEQAWKDTKEFFGDLFIQTQHHCRYLNAYYERFDYALSTVEQFAAMLQKTRNIDELKTKLQISLPQVEGIKTSIKDLMTHFKEDVNTDPSICKEYLSKLVPEESMAFFQEIDNEIAAHENKLAGLFEKYEKNIKGEELNEPCKEEAALASILAKTKTEDELLRKEIKKLEDDIRLIEKDMAENIDLISKGQKDANVLLKVHIDQLNSQRQYQEKAKKAELQILCQERDDICKKYNDCIQLYQDQLNNAVEHNTIETKHSSGWWVLKRRWVESQTLVLDKSNEIKDKIVQARNNIKEADDRFERLSARVEEFYRISIKNLEEDLNKGKDAFQAEQSAKATFLDEQLQKRKETKAHYEDQLQKEKAKIPEMERARVETLILHAKQSEKVKALEAKRQDESAQLKKLIDDVSKQLEECLKKKEEKLNKCGATNTAHAIALSTKCFDLFKVLHDYQVRIGDFVDYGEMFERKVEDQIQKINYSFEGLQEEINSEDISRDEVQQWAEPILKGEKYANARENFCYVEGETVRQILKDPEFAQELGIPANDKLFAMMWKSKWGPRIAQIQVTKVLNLINQSVQGLREIFIPRSQELKKELKSVTSSTAISSYDSL